MEREQFTNSQLKIRNFNGPLNDAIESESDENEVRRKWHGLKFDVSPGDVIIIRGASGTGKSTLLKKIANLFSVESGDEHSSISLDSIPVLGYKDKDRLPMYPSNIYRSRIGYVAQRPALFAGTPFELYETLKRFKAYNKNHSNSIHSSSGDLEAGLQLPNGSEEVIETSAGPGWRMDIANITETLLPELESIPNECLIDLPVHDLVALAFSWGIEKKKLSTPWSKLSGGEAQRISLALAVHMRFLYRDSNAKSFEKGNWITFLLDEPTSALDYDSCTLIENGMICGKAMQDVAILWITHSDEQAQRIERSLVELNKSKPEQRKRVCKTLNLGVS